MIGIYQIRNNLNGMRYIGQSIDIERRWREEREHKRLQVNEHLRRAFEKYGKENFTFSVLCECAPEELVELEQFIILETESYIKTKGYNKTLGGEGFGVHTPERRAKAAQRYSGAGNPFYGKTHTEEIKRKMSEARTGEKHRNYGKHHADSTRLKMSQAAFGGNNHNSKRVIQKTKAGEIVKTYDSAADAARAMQTARSAIKNCASGRTATSCGYRWEYEN